MQQPQVVPVQKPEAATVADPPPIVERPSPRGKRKSDEGEDKEDEGSKAIFVGIFFCIIFVVVVVIVAVVISSDSDDDSDCFGAGCSTESTVYDAYSIFENDGFSNYYYERCYDVFHTCSGGNFRNCSIIENRCREFD